ncbi:glycosyl hydrolase [Aspergillus karnatakaensis]|uniref:glycosyl hydrolase n=1 Tax=Aspergillus karnatakaensis TaxID=1810916 RepID=UPI003CCCCA9A
MSTFTNPILPGFYPDPSCIRVGDTFYMANSSFQFFPGIPIHKSKDLINWELIGNAINRPSQLDLSAATTKVNNAARGEIFTGGVYAPTIRFHKGTFYIVCTMLSGTVDMKSDEDFQPRNFIISATDLEDPQSYSDLIYFDFYGIDPSLFFDDDTGKVYVQGSWIHGYRKTPATVIRQAEIDLATGELLSECKDIWGGHTGKVPEGPHIYKKDGWYYLLIAEGGTHGRHKITMARARGIWGPYDTYQGNPVLTAEGSSGVVQCVGHGDLVLDGEGQWWCVMLARREYGGSFPLGRETFLTAVEWEEGEFPVFETVEVEQRVQRSVASKLVDGSFKAVELKSPLALYLRTPELEYYKQDGSEIILTPTEGDLDALEGTLTFVGQRQTSLDSAATVTLPMDVSPARNAFYGLAVYKDPFRYVALEYSAEHSVLSLKHQEAGKGLVTVSSISIQDATALQLSITSTTEKYTFRALKSPPGDGKDILSGEVPCSALSGDDFTGTVYAIYASGDNAPVKFKDFEIQN